MSTAAAHAFSGLPVGVQIASGRPLRVQATLRLNF